MQMSFGGLIRGIWFLLNERYKEKTKMNFMPCMWQ